MWYNPETKQVAQTHSDIRAACPMMSLPAVITDECIAETGFVPIVTYDPVYDPLTQNAIEVDPSFDGTQYEQDFMVVDVPQAIADTRKAAAAALVQADIAQYLGTVREYREAILNRLAGIAAVAIMTDDIALKASFLGVRSSLLGITTLGGDTRAEVESRVKTEYVRICTLYPSIRNAFNLAGI